MNGVRDVHKAFYPPDNYEKYLSPTPDCSVFPMTCVLPNVSSFGIIIDQ